MDARVQADRQRYEAVEQKGAANRARVAADVLRRQAEANEKDATAVLGFLSNVVIQGQMDEFFKADPAEMTLRQALVNAEPKVAAFLRTQPAAEATVRHLIGLRVLGLGAGPDAAFAVRQLERAWDVRRKLLGPGHPDALDTALALAAAHGDGNPARAVEVLEETRAAVAARPATPAAPADLMADKHAMLTEALAGAYAEVGRFDESVALHRELLARPGAFIPRAYCLRDLGRVLLQAGRPAEAEPVLREALAEFETTDAKGWMRFVVVGDLGASLLDQRKYAAAEPLLVTAYEELKRREGADLDTGPLRGDADHVFRDLVDRLVRLYEATNQPEKAAAWRVKRVPQVAPPPRPVGR